MSTVGLFDALCNFCSASHIFIIDADKAKRIRFATLQSAVVHDLLAKYGVGNDIDSIVLIEDDQAFTRSTAALRIAKHLDGIWSYYSYFAVIPEPIRDFYYSLFAKYRYKLFGKKETCMIPTPDVRARFL